MEVRRRTLILLLGTAVFAPGCLGGDGDDSDQCSGDNLIDATEEVAPGARAVIPISGDPERQIDIRVERIDSGAKPALTVESPVGEQLLESHPQRTIEESFQLTEEGEYQLTLENAGDQIGLWTIEITAYPPDC